MERCQARFFFACFLGRPDVRKGAQQPPQIDIVRRLADDGQMENMTEPIKAESVNPDEMLAQSGSAERTLLPDELPGVAVRYCALKEGNRITLKPRSDAVRVLFFVGGKGCLTIDSHGFEIGEMAVAAASRNAAAAVESTSAAISFLDIELKLVPEDKDELSSNEKKLPYFRPYSECEAYREAIKSAKTVSRTLIPPHLLPRFTMGSVQTTGPDAVNAHQHAMLEQLFFGLQGNNCSVQADAREISFGEGMLLHIPLGSLHGARVEEGAALHYLWLDFFMRQEDMGYIAEKHLPMGK